MLYLKDSSDLDMQTLAPKIAQLIQTELATKTKNTDG